MDSDFFVYRDQFSSIFDTRTNSKLNELYTSLQSLLRSIEWYISESGSHKKNSNGSKLCQMVCKKIMFQTYIIFYNIFASKQVSICTVLLEFTLTKLASLFQKELPMNPCEPIFHCLYAPVVYQLYIYIYIYIYEPVYIRSGRNTQKLFNRGRQILIILIYVVEARV